MRERDFDMKKIVLLISSLMIISCGGGGGGGGTPTEPSPTGHTVSFSLAAPAVGSNYVKMEQVSISGDTVTIAVKAVSIAEPVGGMALDVDTSRLEFVSASNGDVVSGNTSSFVATDSNGTVIVSVTDVPDASPSSNGTLFTIRLKGISTGTGSVGITNSTLFNAGGSAISGVSWYGGTVTVQ